MYRHSYAVGVQIQPYVVNYTPTGTAVVSRELAGYFTVEGFN